MLLARVSMASAWLAREYLGIGVRQEDCGHALLSLSSPCQNQNQPYVYAFPDHFSLCSLVASKATFLPLSRLTSIFHTFLDLTPSLIYLSTPRCTLPPSKINNRCSPYLQPTTPCPTPPMSAFTILPPTLQSLSTEEPSLVPLNPYSLSPTVSVDVLLFHNVSSSMLWPLFAIDCSQQERTCVQCGTPSRSKSASWTGSSLMAT
jgi:hypothetical protein